MSPSRRQAMRERGSNGSAWWLRGGVRCQDGRETPSSRTNVQSRCAPTARATAATTAVRNSNSSIMGVLLAGGDPYGSNLLSAEILPPVAEKPSCIDFLPNCAHHVPVHTVVAIVQEGAEAFGLGAICEVWGEPDHPEDKTPTFDFSVCTPDPGRVRGASGFDLHVEQGLEAVERADLVCIVPKRDFLDQDPRAVEAVRRAAGRGAVVLAHCTGSFLLGEAGLLDG